jgi:hypothetical protein
MSILGCWSIFIAVPLAGLGILLGIYSIVSFPKAPALGIVGLTLSLLGGVLPVVVLVLFVYADQPAEVSEALLPSPVCLASST